VLLVLAPLASLSLAGQEDGRTIPLVDPIANASSTVRCPHHCYSINSSAIALILFGMLRLRAFAVLRLMTSSRVAGC
jgi:hypothetical protein